MQDLLTKFPSYLETQNASAYTIKNYGNDIGQFLDYCCEQGINTLESVTKHT
jgi:site-specific recombinase XerD